MSSLHRGTLRSCILNMADFFRRYKYEYLSIIFNPSGKYYTLIDDVELDRKGDDREKSGQRLVCRVSLRELYSFTRTDQRDLFKEANNADDQTDL